MKKSKIDITAIILTCIYTIMAVRYICDGIISIVEWIVPDYTTGWIPAVYYLILMAAIFLLCTGFIIGVCRIAAWLTILIYTVIEILIYAVIHAYRNGMKEDEDYKVGQSRWDQKLKQMQNKK